MSSLVTPDLLSDCPVTYWGLHRVFPPTTASDPAYPPFFINLPEECLTPLAQRSPSCQ